MAPGRGGQGRKRVLECGLCGCKWKAESMESWQTHVQGIRHRRNALSAQLYGTKQGAHVPVRTIFEDEQHPAYGRALQEKERKRRKATCASKRTAELVEGYLRRELVDHAGIENFHGVAKGMAASDFINIGSQFTSWLNDAVSGGELCLGKPGPKSILAVASFFRDNPVRLQRLSATLFVSAGGPENHARVTAPLCTLLDIVREAQMCIGELEIAIVAAEAPSALETDRGQVKLGAKRQWKKVFDRLRVAAGDSCICRVNMSGFHGIACSEQIAALRDAFTHQVRSLLPSFRLPFPPSSIEQLSVKGSAQRRGTVASGEGEGKDAAPWSAREAGSSEQAEQAPAAPRGKDPAVIAREHGSACRH